MDVRENEAAWESALRGRQEDTVDPRIVASIALHGHPSWAGDLIGLDREETDALPVPASPSAGVSSRPSPAVAECPLHTAMRHLAEAAVAQHVLYLEGEVQARADLVNAISGWERIHTLIRECICPATREVSIGSAVLTAGIVATTLERMFAPEQKPVRRYFTRSLEACAACQSASECPLGTSLRCARQG